MMRPERHLGPLAAISVVLVLFLTLCAAGPRASIASATEFESAAVSMTAGPSVPASMDDAPCFACYIASPSAPRGPGGQCKEPAERSWRIHLPPVPDTVFFDTGGRHVRLPVRTAFCRWLN